MRNADYIINTVIIANRTYARLVIGVTVAAAIAVFLYSLLIPPTYKATSQIIIAGLKADSSIIKDYDSLERFVNNQYRIITGEKILNDVMQKLHLGISKRFIVSDPLALIRKMIRVRYVRHTNIIEIDVYSDNPVLATQISTLLVEEYSRAVRGNNFAVSQQAFTWLNETSSFNKKIKLYERVLYRETKHNDPVRVEAEIKALADTQHQLLNQQGDATFKIRNLENQMAYIDSIIAQHDFNELGVVFKSDDELYYLKRRKSELENQLYEERTSAPQSDRIAGIEEEIKNIENDMLKRAETELATKRTDLAFLKKQLEALDNAISKNTAERARLTKIKARQEILIRQKEMYQALYNKAIDSFKTGAIGIIDIRGITTPAVDSIPDIASPNIPLNTLCGLVIGFMLAQVFIYLRMRTQE
ncbi:MAG: hypothetical protein PHS37_02490 [Candidatus Omnitrophica bacterium]|nr:hypothetical protein [Candidatus Omnitrophota bacterium]